MLRMFGPLRSPCWILKQWRSLSDLPHLTSLLPSALTNLVLHWDGAGEVPVVLRGELCPQPAALLAGHHRHRGHSDLLCWTTRASWQIVFLSFICCFKLRGNFTWFGIVRQFPTIKYSLLEADREMKTWKLFDISPPPAADLFSVRCVRVVVSVLSQSRLKLLTAGAASQSWAGQLSRGFLISESDRNDDPTHHLHHLPPAPPLINKLFDFREK